MPNFAAFVSYVLVTTFTPGPNNIMAMSNASRNGFKKSIQFNVGMAFGFFFVIGLCSIFSVVLYDLIPTIKPVMTYIGAAYILWLTWKTYNSKPPGESDDKNDAYTFSSGLFLQFVNPKVILYGITTVSTFIVPYYISVFALTGFSTLLALVGFTAVTCWSLFGAAFQKILVNNNRTVNIVMSLLLLYCAVSLFF
jgi:cysteine/O-acetylserine efflux protein